ncbi:MAG: hypothetical protein RLZZ500_2579 [Bacteroidota bacterium]|jgi:glycosyltransferase involved in cell wall biosynthesis
MKKALILTPSFLPVLNGMTYATLGHARMLSNLGLEITIISNDCPDQDAINEFGLSNVSCIKFPISGSGLFWNPVRGPVVEILNKINSINPDYIFVEGWYNWGIHLLTRLPKTYLKIVFSHGAADKDVYNLASLVRWLGYFVHDRIYRKKIIKAVNGIILLSVYEDMKRFSDYRLAKQFSIPNIIIPNINVEEVFTKKLQYLTKTTKGFNIAVIGEMSPNKNQSYIIDRFDKLETSINIHFFYPRDNAYAQRVKKKCRLFVERITFHQGLDRISINEFIRKNIDVILVLSRTEAQPIVIIDGIFHEIPFVSTNVGCISTFKGGIVCLLDEIVSSLNIICRDNLLRSYYKMNTKADAEMLKFDLGDLDFFLNSFSSIDAI